MNNQSSLGRLGDVVWHILMGTMALFLLVSVVADRIATACLRDQDVCLKISQVW